MLRLVGAEEYSRSTVRHSRSKSDIELLRNHYLPDSTVRNILKDV